VQLENPLNSSELTFPILECFHIVGFIIAIGSVALVDFRALGFGLRRQKPQQLARDAGLWTFGALAVTVFAGLLLFSTDPDKYYLNVPFLVKMACLVLAILFHFTIRRNVMLAPASPGTQVLVAVISLCLWLSVVIGGMIVSFTAM